MTTRRLVLSLLIAVALALVLAACARRAAPASSHAQTVVRQGPCANLDPDENWFLWWWYGCGDPAAGGGGSGAA